MRELLVRYLLGELDADEQAQLEKQLRESSELRRELAYLQACFAENNDADRPAAEPPRGLAQRTTERVSNFAYEPADVDLFDVAAGRVAAFAGTADPPAGSLGWSLADITVAAGVCLAMSMLLLPALRNSQDACRRVSCTNHQRDFYFVVAPYAERHGGYLPAAKLGEFAGTFILKLISEQYISPQDAGRILACSGSPLGEAIRRGEARIVFPNAEQVRLLQGKALADLFSTSTGSYAVPLGYVVSNRYISPRISDGFVPIFADAPTFNVARIESSNHYGGLNVLYAGGCVKFQTVAIVPQSGDRIFTNTLGQPAAGRGEHDVVLVSGDRTPGIEPMNLSPIGSQPSSLFAP